MRLLYITKNILGGFVLSFAIIVTSMIFFLPSGFCHDTEKEKVVVGEFSQGNLTNWEKKVFAGESRYQLVQVDGQTVLKGEAKASASGLFKKIHVDLTQTPFLNWSWRVEKAHRHLEERSKEGDDYAARIYLVVDGGVFFWKTISLNYVWSSSLPEGSAWPSSYAGKNVMLLALRSNEHKLSTWYIEKRNIYEDFKNLFEKDITHIDAIAIMTDSDDSGGEVEAYYGDLFFSKE